jgi:hemerythrin superfamily protein
MTRFVRSLLEQVAHEEEMIFPRKVLKTTANWEQKLLTTVDVERILIPVPY